MPELPDVFSGVCEDGLDDRLIAPPEEAPPAVELTLSSAADARSLLGATDDVSSAYYVY